MDCSTPGFPILHYSWSLLKLMSIDLMMPSNHLILCLPLLLLPSVFPSIKVFAIESALWITWPKYCSFSFTISSSNEYSGLSSFSIDRLDLLAVQRTLKNLFQHHSSKESILWCSASNKGVLTRLGCESNEKWLKTLWMEGEASLGVEGNSLEKMALGIVGIGTETWGRR